MKAVAVAVAVSAILGLVTMALAGSAGAEDWSGAYAGFTAGSAMPWFTGQSFRRKARISVPMGR